jgi:UDP-glucose 4-epimerase
MLVTGSCGFIGSNLVDRLIEMGHDVVGIDDLSADAHDHFYFNPKAEYHKYSVTDYIMCSDVFKRHKFDYVFHLAAEARIQRCIIDPTLCLETNTMGTQTMLSLAKKYDVKRLVFMSTSAIYGLRSKVVAEMTANGDQKETDEPDCLNAYSYSKWFGEGLCKMYSTLYDLDTVCFRGFNIYGERQPKRGQYAPVIGVFQRQVKSGEPLSIVGDGQQKRDFVHVGDVCDALYEGAVVESNQRGEIYNIGTGKNHSVLQVANLIARHYNHKFDHIHLPAREGEARVTLANIKKIKSNLKWEPKVVLEDWISRQD